MSSTAVNVRGSKTNASWPLSGVASKLGFDDQNAIGVLFAPYGETGQSETTTLAELHAVLRKNLQTRHCHDARITYISDLSTEFSVFATDIEGSQVGGDDAE